MNIKLCLSLLLLSQFLFAQKEIPLYKGKPPGSENWNWSEKISEENDADIKLIYNVSEPTLTAYLPPSYLATGTAVIIAPGGGLHILAIDKEGTEVAKWLNSKGVAAFVLKHRLVHLETDTPIKEMSRRKTVEEDACQVAPLAMADGLAALKYVREPSSVSLYYFINF